MEIAKDTPTSSEKDVLTKKPLSLLQSVPEKGLIPGVLFPEIPALNSRETGMPKIREFPGISSSRDSRPTALIAAMRAARVASVC